MFQAGADSFSWSKSIWSDLGKCCRLAQTLLWKITRAGLQVLLSNDLVFHLSIIKVWWQRPTNTCLWLTASIVPGKKCSRSQQVMKQETKKQSHLFTCLALHRNRDASTHLYFTFPQCEILHFIGQACYGKQLLTSQIAHREKYRPEFPTQYMEFLKTSAQVLAMLINRKRKMIFQRQRKIMTS